MKQNIPALMPPSPLTPPTRKKGKKGGGRGGKKSRNGTVRNRENSRQVVLVPKPCAHSSLFPLLLPAQKEEKKRKKEARRGEGERKGGEKKEKSPDRQCGVARSSSATSL